MGEHLRKKRIDLSLSMAQLAKQLGLEVTESAIERWEKNLARPTEANRARIVKFLGFEPERQSVDRRGAGGGNVDPCLQIELHVHD